MTRHESADLALRFRPDASAATQRPHKVTVAQRISAESGGSDLGVSLEKCFDIVEQRSHE
ncbi:MULTISPECIES: hypothetical protein [Sphingomonas]|uniref:hypothetical protein n=1 Tax=Sphingomonas TaxID=13687 RepID=UPI0025516ADA|nr:MULTISPECIES: hypothetical protein [Sphingomonas]MDK8187746.1 hypothetical protein [Sphingomonas zeae]MDK8217601.1 hypothetical protein [Sphingomonas sp. UMB7805-LC452B]